MIEDHSTSSTHTFALKPTNGSNWYIFTALVLFFCDYLKFDFMRRNECEQINNRVHDSIIKIEIDKSRTFSELPVNEIVAVYCVCFTATSIVWWEFLIFGCRMSPHCGNSLSRPHDSLSFQYTVRSSLLKGKWEWSDESTNLICYTGSECALDAITDLLLSFIWYIVYSYFNQTEFRCRRRKTLKNRFSLLLLKFHCQLNKYTPGRKYFHTHTQQPNRTVKMVDK